MFFRLALTLLFLLLLSPGILFASSTTCTKSFIDCECVDADGTGYSVNSSEDTGDSCASACQDMGATSYAFYCGDENTPVSADEISDWNAARAESVSGESTPSEESVIPALNVPIPGLNLEGSVQRDNRGNIEVNMIGLYVNAVFSYSIVLAAIFGVLMLTIAGFQYMTAGGNKNAVAKAKGRMQNTVFGLILLMATYAIAFLIDPRTTRFQPLTLQNIEEITLSENTAGQEGSGSPSGSGTWQSLSEPYRTIVSQAKENLTCHLPDMLASPTGNLPNQGNHHWFDRGANGIWSAINNLDWAAPWNSPIYAPFAGTVTYEQQKDTSNRCGNRIYLRSANGEANITICHAKDFTDENGNFESRRTVEQGEVIGHVGGVCCSGQSSPSSFITKCTAGGTMCTDPTRSQNCSCQRISESGNTTGPHVHISYGRNTNGMILACLE